MGPSLPPAALILVLLALGSTMHIGRSSSLHSSTASELATLQQQQSSFEKSINNLIEDIQAVEVKVNATSDTNEKVILLEKAVTSERQKIHDLQTQIAPAFSLSKNSCQQLTS
jgi:peptidoglycan hydrolase CwlO-like protein